MFSSRPPPFALPAACEAALRAAYARPPRAYHTAGHVAEVVGEYERVADAVGWDHPRDVYWAILCHDAIYEAGRPDNEQKSAALARRLAALWLRGAQLDLDRVEALILLTARHGALDAGALGRDAAHFVDCDMAILGAAPARFDAYDDAIAIEYAAVPRDAYRSGRRRFLTSVLASPRIFHSDFFHERLDAAARENLARALERLSAPGAYVDA
jgi:predicted metal-dependent HD superfamily phosphohydrolase